MPVTLAENVARGCGVSGLPATAAKSYGRLNENLCCIAKAQKLSAGEENITGVASENGVASAGQLSAAAVSRRMASAAAAKNMAINEERR